MTELSIMGSSLAKRTARPCGLCGRIQALTRTHVPPQVAGNGKTVRRASDVIDEQQVRD
jgi:hypothetical protein